MTSPTPAPRSALVRLAVPIVAVNVGTMLMGVVDTIIVGHVSPQALAAVALGNVYASMIQLGGIGILLAADPLLNHALGANDAESFSRDLQRALVLAAALGVVGAGLSLLGGAVLEATRQPADVVPLAARYCAVLAPAMLPFMLFAALRQGLQARHRVAPVMWAMVVGNLINAALNWTLIFGHLGAPPMGVAGSALATTIARYSMVVVLLIAGGHALRADTWPLRKTAVEPRALGRLLRMGLPLGLQVELEIAAFSIVALLMGQFGTVAVAGHQIALNLASLTFMVPMGIGMAAAVVVGNAVGAGDRVSMSRDARRALLLGAGFMALTGAAMIAAPRAWASIYSSDPLVTAYAAMLLPIAGVFQVFDGVQAVCVGVLRGMGDTRMPAIINAIGFGVGGLSVSFWLAFRTPLAGRGLWWGLVVGLAIVAVVLALRVRLLLGRPLSRLTL